MSQAVEVEEERELIMKVHKILICYNVLSLALNKSNQNSTSIFLCWAGIKYILKLHLGLLLIPNR